jgi:hypothetical protein
MTTIIIGVDCEYQETTPGKNEPLSYQWYGIGPKGEWGGIHHVHDGKRISLPNWIAAAILDGMAKRMLDGWPSDLILAAHYDAAELSMTKDFGKWKVAFALVRGKSWVSRGRPKNVLCWD